MTPSSPTLFPCRLGVLAFHFAFHSGTMTPSTGLRRACNNHSFPFR